MEAADATDYHARLAERLLERFPAMRSACDLGAGAGELSLALATRGIQVTAMEQELYAVEHLRARATQEGLQERIQALACDWTPEDGTPPHDVVVLSYCSGVREHWPRIAALANHGVAILNATGTEEAPFGLPGLPPLRRDGKRERGPIIRACLEAYGVAFTEETFHGELGQPLQDAADLHTFLHHYFRGQAEQLQDIALAQCRPLPDGRLYLPRWRESALFCVHCVPSATHTDPPQPSGSKTAEGGAHTAKRGFTSA